MEFKEYTVQELIDMKWLDKPMDGNHGGKHPASKDYVNEGIPFIMVSDINDGKINYETCKYITVEQRNKLDKGFSKPGDVLLSHKATIGLTCIVDDKYDEIVLTPQLTYYRVLSNINSIYLKYYFDSFYFQNTLNTWAKAGSTRPYLGITAQLKLPIRLPNIQNQNKIAKILSDIDKKIDLNNNICKNLENQLKIIFENNILNKLEDSNTYECTLYDQFDVIDNRGKTPPLVDYSNYPIIDVKVLSGSERVINYNNCLKYVDKNTYDTFFRSGHPKKYDTLLSTVGSLAEIKLYIDNTGTIAQNVVALRPKSDYPLFMYQYILSLKQRLTSYDIGSVQPSIKVTQFMRENIKMPNDKDIIYEFEKISKSYTNMMYCLTNENKSLENVKSTLLQKLMNGEIDLDNIEI